MNYTVDIKEIVAFIDSSSIIEASDYNSCLSLFTEKTEEPFLDERANYILNIIDSDIKLQSAFRKLAYHCKEEESHCKLCQVRKYCNSYIVRSRKKAGSTQLQMIDLFCGAGGLSLGFTQEGFVTALANDIEDCCVDTYAHNHPETPRNRIIKGDIREVVKDLGELIGNKKIDIVVGGPPCQGFSMANRQRLIDDPRNYLYKNFVEVVRKVKPQFFVMENVKGMYSVANQVKEDFRNIGYEVECHVLNAKDYGIPQNRERLIYIGNCKSIDNEKIFTEIFELSKSIPDHVLSDAIHGLRELTAARVKNSTDIDTEESGYLIERDRLNLQNEYISLINQGRVCPVLCNHKARFNNDRDIKIFGRMNPGDKSDDPKIADIMPYARRNNIFKDKYYKLVPDKVSKTITAHMKFDCNMYIHPTQARGLTPREAARIQSYPDDYYFRGAYTKTYMQIGNSVPPLLGRAIAQIIKKYISEEK